MIEQHDDETFAAYLRRLVDAGSDGEVSWGQLTDALDEAADEIEHLEARVDRLMGEVITQAYRLGGKP